MNEDTGIKDLYPSERKACQGIMAALQLKHCFRGVTLPREEERILRAFEIEARNRFAEIGLILGEVQWEWKDERTGQCSPDVSSDPSDNNLYFYPRPIVTGRIEKIEEVDHDRMKHEIRAGMLDGKEGVMDPNTGQLKDSPRKKNIY